MIHSAKEIGALLCGIALTAGATGGGLAAQTSLPATSPTSITPSQLPSANPAVVHGSSSIHWDGRLLQIEATGQSLQQVFSEIASRTDIHITGNAPEDRLYGTYGPAPLVEVLSDLVSGLPVNMLFVERTGKRPAELSFTARTGAATPPSASSPQQYAQAPQQPPPQAPQQVFGPGANSPAANNPGASAESGAPAAATQPADSTNAASPNGVKTPQEIFEQLQRLRANSGAPRQ